MSYSPSDLKVTDPSLKELFITLLNLRNHVDSGFTYNVLFVSPTAPVRTLSTQRNSTMPVSDHTSPLTVGEVLLQRLDSLLLYLLSLSFIDTDGDFQDSLQNYVTELKQWEYAYLPFYSALSDTPVNAAAPTAITTSCTIHPESLLRFILLTDKLRFYLDGRRISDPLLQTATTYNQLQQAFNNYTLKVKTFEDELSNFKADHPDLQNEIQQLSNAMGFANDIEQLKITATGDADKVKASAEEIDRLQTTVNSANKLIETYKEAKGNLDTEIQDLIDQNKTLHAKNEQEYALINDILRGATSVSLARAFKEKSDALMDRQILWFLILFGSLALVVFWNVLHLTPQLAEDLVGFSLSPVLHASVTAWSPWINFLYTEITCLPFFWMAWLATSLIRSTFKLMEDYDYKATSASTYVGYRDEADKLEKDDNAKPLKKKVFNSVINRLEEHPLRVMEKEASGSPLHDLISLLSSSKFQKALSKTGEEGENFLKELISVLTDLLRNSFGSKRDEKDKKDDPN